MIEKLVLDWELEGYEELGTFADDFEPVKEDKARAEVPEEQRSWLYDLI